MKTKRCTTIGILLVLTVGLLFTTCKDDSISVPATVTDIDGNVYHTVKIGSQGWLKENLRVTHYNNGDEIPNVTDNWTWGSSTSGACCDYENKPDYSSTYGKIYNGYAVIDERKICPEGWHVPTDDEWTALTNSLGGDGVAGGKLKETGTTHWVDPNVGATDAVGFSAVPGGYRQSYDGDFDELGTNANHWSSTTYTLDDPSIFYLHNLNIHGDQTVVYHGGYGLDGGHSVRCIMD